MTSAYKIGEMEFIRLTGPLSGPRLHVMEYTAPKQPLPSTFLSGPLGARQEIESVAGLAGLSEALDKFEEYLGLLEEESQAVTWADIDLAFHVAVLDVVYITQDTTAVLMAAGRDVPADTKALLACRWTVRTVPAPDPAPEP